MYKVSEILCLDVNLLFCKVLFEWNSLDVKLILPKVSLSETYHVRLIWRLSYSYCEGRRNHGHVYEKLGKTVMCTLWKDDFGNSCLCLNEYTTVNMNQNTHEWVGGEESVTSCIIFQMYLRHFHMYRDTVERVWCYVDLYYWLHWFSAGDMGVLYEVYRFMLSSCPDFPSALDFALPLVARSSGRLTHGEVTSGLEVIHPVRVGVFMYSH